MFERVVLLMVDGLVFAVCLWLAMGLTKVKGSFWSMVIIVAVSALLALIPYAGWILSAIGMYVLICKLTDAEFWPDAVLMVIVAQILAYSARALLKPMLG